MNKPKPYRIDHPKRTDMIDYVLKMTPPYFLSRIEHKYNGIKRRLIIE